MASDTRYIIGIDLGTTNSSVSYVDTNREKNPALAIRPFPVPQLTAHSSFEPKPSLPSFLYLLDRQLDAETLTVPWDSEASCIVGHYARAQGGRSPTRLVQSAKSWLCNASAHRRDP
ncbi:MAG: hypothetical protein KDK78_06775, partial [Chlamydiia bacterium]|nr:hypothetical protein [Chlamydiia bacterium]